MFLGSEIFILVKKWSQDPVFVVTKCRRNMVGSLPRGMPKVVDYRQTDVQATNKMVTQDRHKVFIQVWPP